MKIRITFIFILIVSTVFIFVIHQGYKHDLNWVGVSGKTLWDWLDLLLVAVFIVIGTSILGLLKSITDRRIAQDQRTEDRKIAKEQLAEDRKIAKEHAELGREIARQERQQISLNAYINQMTNLLLEKDLNGMQIESHNDNEPESPKNLARKIARTLTLIILKELDPIGKGQVLQFLYSTYLIIGKNPIVSLKGADFQGVDLSYQTFHYVNFDGANFNNNANLQYAQFYQCSFLHTDMNDSDLCWSNFDDCLISAGLQNSNLSNTGFESCIMTGTSFWGCKLVNTRFDDNNLSKTKWLKEIAIDKNWLPKIDIIYAQIVNNIHFKKCNFTHAKITQQQINCMSFDADCTMPPEYHFVFPENDPKNNPDNPDQ